MAVEGRTLRVLFFGASLPTRREYETQLLAALRVQTELAVADAERAEAEAERAQAEAERANSAERALADALSPLAPNR